VRVISNLDAWFQERILLDDVEVGLDLERERK